MSRPTQPFSNPPKPEPTAQETKKNLRKTTERKNTSKTFCFLLTDMNIFALSSCTVLTLPNKFDVVFCFGRSGKKTHVGYIPGIENKAALPAKVKMLVKTKLHLRQRKTRLEGIHIHMFVSRLRLETRVYIYVYI